MPNPKVMFIDPKDRKNFNLKGAQKVHISVKMKRRGNYGQIEGACFAQLRTKARQKAQNLANTDGQNRGVTLINMRRIKRRGILTLKAQAAIIIAA